MLSIQGSRVLVTGGSGLIGSHTVDALLKEGVERVTVLDSYINKDNLSEVLGRPDVSIVAGNLNDQDAVNHALQGTDYVIHLAGLLLLPSMRDPHKAIKVNIDGTFDLLELALDKGVKKVVYASSVSVYGTPKTNDPVDEDYPFYNRTIYGAGKIACEQLCRVLNDTRGLDYIALRYSSVYGPRQHLDGLYPRLIMQTLAAINENRVPRIEGSGNEVQDLIYVEDVARANVLALKCDISDRAYNIVSGIPVTIKDVLTTVLQLRESSLPIEFIPKQSGKELVAKRRFSGARAEKDIGFLPQTGLHEGLRRMIAWASSWK